MFSLSLSEVLADPLSPYSRTKNLFASLKLSALTKKAEPYGLVCGGLSESAAISMIHGRCTQVQRRLTPQRHSKFAASSIEPEPL